MTNKEKEAIEILKSYRKRLTDSVSNQLDKDIEVFEMAIKALENQKEGRWKKISPAGIYECTCCGQDVMTSDIECYKFCHGCGARMEG